MISTCAHTKTRSSTSVAPPSPNRPESAFETGDHDAGHSFRPSAIRDACQSSSVVTIPAISARIRSASPRWLPSKRAGRWTLRIATAPITPTSTSTANTSTISANQPWWPSHGSVASRLDGADHRDHDRGEEHQEAPEDRCVDQARHEALEQLLLAEHDHGLVLDPLGHVVEALDRLAEPHEVHEQLRAAAEQRAADREHRGERERSQRYVYEDCAFLSSAVIAGTISARSPITA